MRISIAYDSVYGNTELVARAIADAAEAEGHAVELISLRTSRQLPTNSQILFIGGPTHMKTMTSRVRRFIKKLDPTYWGEHPVVVFDTFGPVAATEEERAKQRPWIEPGAAGHIQELSRLLGLSVFPKTLRCAVTGIKGPLSAEALEAAREFVRDELGPNQPVPEPGHELAEAATRRLSGITSAAA